MKGPQTWADLGAGSGMFTMALGHLLPSASSVYAVDRDLAALNMIPWNHADKTLVRIHADVESNLTLPSLDGVLLANVLHYIMNKAEVMERFRGYLRRDGVFIVVEYDTTKPNHWVPYPLSLNSMKKLATHVQCSVRLLGTVPSRFNSGDLYSVLLSPLK